MIIVHTLRLGYHDYGSQQHRELYIALDMDDIATLKEIAARAQEKTKTLKGQLDVAGIRSIDLS
jgi:hypothetical protein